MGLPKRRAENYYSRGLEWDKYVLPNQLIDLGEAVPHSGFETITQAKIDFSAFQRTFF